MIPSHRHFVQNKIDVGSEVISEKSFIGDIQLKKKMSNTNFGLKNSGTIVVLTMIEKYFFIFLLNIL